MPEAQTLLELGSGGGNNASHLQRALHVHALRPLAADAERSAAPSTRAASTSSATCGRSGSAGRSTPSSSTTRSCTWRPRTTCAPASGRPSPTRGPAAWRSSSPTARARRSRPARTTAATTAPTAARCATSSGRPTPTRATRAFEIDYAVVLHEPGQQPRARPRPPRRRASSPSTRGSTSSNGPASPRRVVPGDPDGRGPRAAALRLPPPGLARPHGGPRRVDVAGDLRDQRVLALEGRLVPESLPELDDEPLAVQVAVEVEQERLDAPLRAAVVRVRADRDRRAVVERRARVDPVSRARELGVRARCSPSGSRACRRAGRRRRRCRRARTAGRASARRRRALASRTASRIAVDETPSTSTTSSTARPAAVERLDRSPDAPVPEAEVSPDGDGLRADRRQVRRDELVRREPHELGREGRRRASRRSRPPRAARAGARAS